MWLCTHVCGLGCRVWAVSDSVRFVCYGLGELALPCLGFIAGAGWLPRRLGICCICAAWVPDALTVGAAPMGLCLVPWWRRVRCAVSVAFWFYALTAAWLGVAVCTSCSVAGLRLWFSALDAACSCLPNHRGSLYHTCKKCEHILAQRVIARTSRYELRN